MDGEGSLLMGGYKTRIGSSSSKGRFDLVVIKLNASTGTEEDWRWQVGACGTGAMNPWHVLAVAVRTISSRTMGCRKVHVIIHRCLIRVHHPLGCPA